MSKIIVIGAGIGGLATANLLAQAGHEVAVYEQSSKPGGRAGTLHAEGFTFDTGPSWYLMPEVFERYYQSLGLDVNDYLDIIRLSPSYRVFFESDAPLTITGDLSTDSLSFEAIEKGAGAALKHYAHEAQTLYDLSLKYFLYTSFNSPKDFLQLGILSRLPQMVKLMTTTIHQRIAASFKSLRLQQILEYPMVFLGTSPFEAPALYSLMGALDFGGGVFYPRGGIYTIIESLVTIGSHRGVEYHYDSPVAKIDSRAGRAKGITLEDGSYITADIIVSNADLHYTETKLLDAHHQTYPESYWATKQASSSALLIYLGVRGGVPELEHHNLFFVDAWKKNFDALYHGGEVPDRTSLYVSRTSTTDPGVAPEGHETLFILVPLPIDSHIDQSQVASMADHYIAQVEAMADVHLADRIVYKSMYTPNDFGEQLHSWKNSMLGPSHVLKQSAFWRSSNRSKKLPNLYYVGAGTLPGVGLPMCLIGAANVADRIAKEQTS